MDVTQSRYAAELLPEIVGHGSSRLRSRDLLEIAVGFVLILLSLWSDPLGQLLLGLAALLWIVLVTVQWRPDPVELGLCPSRTRQSLWIVGVAAIAAMAGVWASLRMNTFHAVFRNFAVEWGFLIYIVWALIQQFVLQDFFLARLLRILPSRSIAVIVAGTLFAVAHVPNPLLMIATLIWGIVSCALFLRYRNLYVLGLAHAILGMCLAVTIPNAVHHQMRVGIGYLRWHGPVQRREISRFAATVAPHR